MNNDDSKAAGGQKWGEGMGKAGKNTLEIDHIEHASAEEVENERGERGGKFRSSNLRCYEPKEELREN